MAAYYAGTGPTFCLFVVCCELCGWTGSSWEVGSAAAHVRSQSDRHGFVHWPVETSGSCYQGNMCVWYFTFPVLCGFPCKMLQA